MRYEYTITKEGGEAEIMKAMSWKKLFKSLLMKYPDFSGWCTYINKKGHVQVRNFKKGKETKKLWVIPNVESAAVCRSRMNGPMRQESVWIVSSHEVE